MRDVRLAGIVAQAHRMLKVGMLLESAEDHLARLTEIAEGLTTK